MPFWDKIAKYINTTLKDGSLNFPVLQPQQLFGLATIIVRRENPSTKAIEQLPGLIDVDGTDIPITPDNNQALQLYHKLDRSVYSEDSKKSFGDIKVTTETSELTLVVLTNSKLTAKPKETIEHLIRFGMPKKLSAELLSELQLRTCTITPTGSNMNHVEVFRREYPNSDYFLNEQMSMFSIRYTIASSYVSCGDFNNIINS
jgi:hypothetical protein